MQPSAPSAASDNSQFVLLEKGTPVRVMRPDNVVLDTTQNPLPTRGFNSLIVDAVPGSTSAATSITILGGPTPGGPWVQEVDAQAFQSGVPTTAPKRFVVTGISAYSAVALTAPVGWTVWFTPFNAAAVTNVQISGTSNFNLAQVAGAAIGGANPVPTSLTGQPITATTTPAQASVQRVSAGYVAPGQTAKSYVGRQATSTSATTTIALATVTTGKTQTFTDIFLTTDSVAPLDVRLQAAGSDIFRTLVRDTVPCDAPGIETQPAGASGNALQLVLPQTQVVCNVDFSLEAIEA